MSLLKYLRNVQANKQVSLFMDEFLSKYQLGFLEWL